MKKQIPYLLFFVALFAAAFAFLEKTAAYHFYYVEQNQFFQETGAYLSGCLSQPGGAAKVVSEYLVQFFLLPYTGAAVTAAWLVLAAWLVWLFLRRLYPESPSYCAALALIPVVPLLFCHLDMNYLPAGTVAFLLATAALWGAGFVRRGNLRLCLHILLVPLLYYLGGPVYLLYALAAALYEALAARRFWALLLPLEALLLGWLAVRLVWAPEYRFAFLPDAYYHFSLAPRPYVYAVWPLLLAAEATAILCRREEAALKATKAWRRRLPLAGACLFVLVFGAWSLRHWRDVSQEKAKEFDYFSRNGQWQRILEQTGGPQHNYVYLAYTNLALMETGRFADRLFDYDQHGVEGWMPGWNKTEFISMLLSDIYFAMDLTGPAQQMAFEANVSTLGEGTPRILKRLVETNLIFGAYPVADKYLRLLSNTWGYRQWAAAHRRFLYNDAAVEADSLLGAKRRALPKVDELSFVDGIDSDLVKMSAEHPSDRRSLVYAGAFYLLGKDMGRFKSLIETWYGKPQLPALPVCFQEAVILVAENDPAYWRRYGVSKEVVARFLDFKRQMLSLKHSGQGAAIPGLLVHAFGNTFWYYYLFKK
ncbi:MAG: DUF6057 family protein [Tannerella sp.]|jgi:hypothetical protein|nr:DUF6057 family protein [Tannerella sp.]